MVLSRLAAQLRTSHSPPSMRRHCVFNSLTLLFFLHTDMRLLRGWLETSVTFAKSKLLQGTTKKQTGTHLSSIRRLCLTGGFGNDAHLFYGRKPF